MSRKTFSKRTGPPSNGVPELKPNPAPGATLRGSNRFQEFNVHAYTQFMHSPLNYTATNNTFYLTQFQFRNLVSRPQPFCGRNSSVDHIELCCGTSIVPFLQYAMNDNIRSITPADIDERALEIMDDVRKGKGFDFWNEHIYAAARINSIPTNDQRLEITKKELIARLKSKLQVPLQIDLRNPPEKQYGSVGISYGTAEIANDLDDFNLLMHNTIGHCEEYGSIVMDIRIDADQWQVGQLAYEQASVTKQQVKRILQEHDVHYPFQGPERYFLSERIPDDPRFGQGSHLQIAGVKSRYY